MQKMFSYMGYFVTASSKQLEGSEKSMTELCNSKSYGSKIPVKEFSSANQWDSEQEAIDKGVIFGKQIVDGKYPDLEFPQ